MAESTDYDSNALNHEPRDTRYPYSSSEDSNDTKHEGEPKPLFEGKLKMLQLTSNRICYGPCPEPDDEVEQHLTITANGRIWFSRYCFGENGKYRLLQKDTFTISSEAAKSIMDASAECFSKTSITEYFTDVGSWNATLTNTDGQVLTRCETGLFLKHGLKIGLAGKGEDRRDLAVGLVGKVQQALRVADCGLGDTGIHLFLQCGFQELIASSREKQQRVASKKVGGRGIICGLLVLFC